MANQRQSTNKPLRIARRLSARIGAGQATRENRLNIPNDPACQQQRAPMMVWRAEKAPLLVVKNQE